MLVLGFWVFIVRGLESQLAVSPGISHPAAPNVPPHAKHAECTRERQRKGHALGCCGAVGVVVAACAPSVEYCKLLTLSTGRHGLDYMGAEVVDKRCEDAVDLPVCSVGWIVSLHATQPGRNHLDEPRNNISRNLTCIGSRRAASCPQSGPQEKGASRLGWGTTKKSQCMPRRISHPPLRRPLWL